MRSRRVAAVLLGAVLVFSPHSAAQAEVQQASSFSARGWACSWGQTWVNNEWGLPGLESVATIDGSVNAWCDVQVQADPGHIAVRQTLLAWDARGWEFECNVGPWQFNQQRSHEVWTWWAFNRPCNTNWYAGLGYSAVLWNGAWRGVDHNPH